MFRRFFDTFHTAWETHPKFKFSKGEGEIKTITDSEGNFYKGQVKDDDIKHGAGVQVTKDGQYIEGHWEDGLLHGRVKIFQPYGDIELFNSEKGKKHGYFLKNSGYGSKEVQEWNQDELVDKYEHRMSLDDLLADTKNEMNTGA